MRFRFALVLVAAALSLLGMGSIASADTASAPGTMAAAPPGCIGPVSPDGGAGACFQPHGEHLYNCDLQANHHPVAFYYRSTSPNTLRSFSDMPGAGNCADHNLDDIPESGWIKVQSCNYEGSTRLNCSGFLTVSANG